MVSISDFIMGQKPGYQASFDQLPQFQQQGVKGFVDRAEQVAGSNDAYLPAAPVPYTPEMTGILNNLQAGNFQPTIGGFGFGQRASQAYDGVQPLLDESAQYTRQAATPFTGEQIQSSIGDFYNPYEQQVVQAQEADANERLGGYLAQARAQASDAGAFGGTAAATYSSDLTRGVEQDLLGNLSNLRYSGYQNAANMGMDRLEGDRTAQQFGAQQFGQLGSQQQSLGNSLMGARQTVENIRDQQYNRNLGTLGAQLEGSSMLRQPALEQAQYDADVRGIPLQQLETLQQAYGQIPSGALKDGGQAGLFGGYGSPSATLTNIAKTGAEYFAKDAATSAAGQLLGPQASGVAGGLQSAALGGLEATGATAGINAAGAMLGLESVVAPASALPGAVAAAGKPLAAGAAGLSGGSGSATLAGGVGADALGGAAGSAAATGGMSTMAALGMTALPFAALAGIGTMTQDGTHPIRDLGSAPDLSQMQDATGLIRQTTDQAPVPPQAAAAYEQLNAAQKNLIRQYTANGGSVMWDQANGRFITSPQQGSFDQGIAIAPGQDIGVSIKRDVQSGLSGAFSPTQALGSDMLRAPTGQPQMAGGTPSILAGSTQQPMSPEQRTQQYQARQAWLRENGTPWM